VRILLVSNYYPEHVGGIETVAASLASGYRMRGHDVRWIAGDIRDRPHHAHTDDVPLRVWNGIEGLGFPYPLPSPSAVARVRRAVHWSEIVHLHDCLYAANIAVFWAARRGRRPVLLTQHVAEVPYPSALVRGMQSIAYASLGRAVLSRADQVVFVSEQVRRWFATRVHFRKPPLVIENGVDGQMFRPASPAERGTLRGRLEVSAAQPLLLFVGRFVEKKGVRLLRPLIEATPQCAWLMIGRGGDVDPSTWRLPNLRVVAQLSPAQLRDYYAAADLLVLPSSGEGFPVVAQEAMACGTPVLLSEQTAAGMPAIRDVVFTTNLGGENLLSALRDALAAVASNPDLRDRLSALAHERWRPEKVVSSYEEQLEGLLP
jgi:glycosyltransferase involved in cell wall biosynthesis